MIQYIRGAILHFNLIVILTIKLNFFDFQYLLFIE